MSVGITFPALCFILVDISSQHDSMLTRTILEPVWGQESNFAHFGRSVVAKKVTLSAHRYFATVAKYYTSCITYQPTPVYCHTWPLRICLVFPRYLINGTIFERKKKLAEYKIYFDFIYKFCLKYFSFCEKLCEILPKIYTALHIKYPPFLSNLNKTLTSSKYFRNPLKYQHFIKLRVAEAKLFHVDGRTGRHDNANNPFS
jgi:hypothetical protein